MPKSPIKTDTVTFNREEIARYLSGVEQSESDREVDERSSGVLPKGEGDVTRADGEEEREEEGSPDIAQRHAAGTKLQPRKDFRGAVRALKSRMFREATDQDIDELEGLLSAAKKEGLVTEERVDFVVDIRLMLDGGRLDLVDADNGRKLTLTIKSGGVYLTTEKTTRPLGEVSVRVQRKPVPSFSKRPSRAKSSGINHSID